nr:MAG: hypothetical protein CM15mP61_01330 [Gammaproteobacteria bacterium]
MNSFLYKFSIFTIFIALVHFTLETLFTIKFGQTIAGYLPDLIAVALLITAGYLTMKDSSAIGILVVLGGLLSVYTIGLGHGDLMM